MEKISDAMLSAGIPELTQYDIMSRVTGKSADLRAALAALIDSGHVSAVDGPRNSRRHTLIRPFPGEPT